MLSDATMTKTPEGWMVKVRWGSLIETVGPFRWRWVARLVRWTNDGQH